MPVLNSYDFVTDSKATKNINDKNPKRKKPEYEQLPAKADNFMPNQIQRTIDANKWGSEDYEPTEGIQLPIDQAAAMRAAMESLSDEAYEQWLDAMEEDAVRNNRPFNRERIRAKTSRYRTPQGKKKQRLLPLGKTYEKGKDIYDRFNYALHIAVLIKKNYDAKVNPDIIHNTEKRKKAEAELQQAWDDLLKDFAGAAIGLIELGIAEAIAFFQLVSSVAENDPRKLQDMINVLRQQLEYARRSNDVRREMALLKEIKRLIDIRLKLIARGK
jgi:hypothetical protein